MEKERKSGFYRVKRNGKWIIAQWLDLNEILPCWLLTGNENMFLDDDFDAIDENKIAMMNE